LALTLESLVDLIAVSHDEFEKIGHHNFLQNIEIIMPKSSLTMNTLLFGFLDKLTLSYETK
jgi:hypothetical protein